jgi:hypothetical protein
LEIKTRSTHSIGESYALAKHFRIPFCHARIDMVSHILDEKRLVHLIIPLNALLCRRYQVDVTRISECVIGMRVMVASGVAEVAGAGDGNAIGWYDSGERCTTDNEYVF